MSNPQDPSGTGKASSTSTSGSSTSGSSTSGSSTSTSPSSTSTSSATAALQAAAAASTTSDQQKQRDAVLACLLQGLATIGINAQASSVIVFSAINSDALCATLAHSIEICLAQKGYNIQALTVPFQQLRANGTQVSVDALVTALVSISEPISGTGGAA